MNSAIQSSTKFAASISRRDALKGLGGILAASAVSGEASAAAAEEKTAPESTAGTLPKQPNILWITGEGVPVNALSCYGGRLLETPNIDRIAKESVRFANSSCTNGLCAPSRATLLTGTYSHINGMVGNPGVPNPGGPQPHFDPAPETIAKILKGHGYQTGLVGKWHLPVTPAQTGFDYFMYKEGAGGPYYDAAGYLGNPSLGGGAVQPYRFEGYETDVMTDLAIKGM